MYSIVNNSKVYNMQNNIKRNSVVVVNYQNTQRLALVKSVNKSTNMLNVTMYLFANASIASDYRVHASSVQLTSVSAKQFTHLAKSYPNYACTNANSVLLFKLQQQADAAYPQLAALRNNYAAYPKAA
jgi:hypothetical protein